MSPAEQLADWVALRHKGQIIKRTREPYFNHLMAVALMAKGVVALGYEIGLCHDLLEDTDTSKNELLTLLLKVGYTGDDASLITSCVVELTDVFTRDAYPDLSKKVRKRCESYRLLTISSAAQTVKYGDLIYNIEWMLKYDQKHALRYLRKKQILLAGLTRGNQDLWQQAMNAIHQGLCILEGN